MEEKRQIDSMRDRGGSVDIGTAEDGAIMEMLPIGKRMLVIKERSVYEMRLADDIDPNRENPNIPSTSQRLIVGLGTESEIFSRTFLTAKRLFKPGHLKEGIDDIQLLFLTLEIVQELAALDKEINDYLDQELKVSNEYNELKGKTNNHAVPSIPDLKTRCKTIFQKADQAYQATLAIIRIFYPDFSKQSYYSAFLDHIKKKYGDNHPFSEFLENALPFILLARNIRNCLDHRRTETEIKDFELQLNLEIFSPTIEVNYLDSKLERVSLSKFLPSLTENLVTVFENLIAYLCANNQRTNSVMQVRYIPEDKRRNKHIRFAYWLPFGSEGFFQQ